MPIEFGLWKLGEKLTPVDFVAIEKESRLEAVLADDISVIDQNLLLIGRQVPTAYGKFVDLLALDTQGNLIVVELKRDRTPREVVAQLLDYGSWVRSLKEDDIRNIFEEFRTKHHSNEPEPSLDDAFCARFSVTEMPAALNESHKLVLVAGHLDDSTERIIDYLADEYGVDINAVFFRFFRDGDNEYLSRAWLMDPREVEAKVEDKREKGTWNGEFYVSFGVRPHRDWEEARKYGFISAGGGAWYSRTLSMLEKDGRIWVNVPGTGYVGVGKVTDEAVPVDEFLAQDDEGKHVPIASLHLKAAGLTTKAHDPEKAEYFVRVEWIKTVPQQDAVSEKGLFGNQNSAAKPKAKKWLHTVQRLKSIWGISD